MATTALRSAATPFTPQEALLARAEMFYSCQAPRTAAEAAEPDVCGPAPPSAACPAAAEGAGAAAHAAAAPERRGAAEQQQGASSRPRGHRVRLDRLLTGGGPPATTDRRPPKQQWRPGAQAPPAAGARCAAALAGPVPVPAPPRRMPSRTPSPERRCAAACVREQPRRGLVPPPRAAAPAPPLPPGGPRDLALSSLVLAPARTPPSAEPPSWDAAARAQEALFLGDGEGLDATEQDDIAQARFQEFMYLRTAKPSTRVPLSDASTSIGGSSRSSHLSSPGQNSPRSGPPARASTAAGPESTFVSAAQDFLASILGTGKVQAGASVQIDLASLVVAEAPQCGVPTCGEDGDDDGDDVEDPEPVPVKRTFIHFDDPSGLKGAVRTGSSAKRETSAPAVMSRAAFRLKFPAMEEAHIRGDCRPCAYFLTKTDGCRRGDQCSYCHLCTDSGKKQQRRKERRGLQ